MKMMITFSLISVIAFQVVALSLVNAAESEPLRLFYGRAHSDRKVDASSQANQLNEKPKNNKAILNPKNDTPVHSEQKVHHATFHYNGFISSEEGDHYFINGTRISEMSSVELISSLDAGRSLQLRTDKGYVFTISMGETKRGVPEKDKKHMDARVSGKTL